LSAGGDRQRKEEEKRRGDSQKSQRFESALSQAQVELDKREARKEEEKNRLQSCHPYHSVRRLLNPEEKREGKETKKKKKKKKKKRSKPFTGPPDGWSRVQKKRRRERKKEISFLEPLYAGGIDDVTPGSRGREGKKKKKGREKSVDPSARLVASLLLSAQSLLVFALKK